MGEIQELYAYNRWANAEALDAASALSEPQFTRDLGNSFPSVRDTLVHILAAEWIWLSRWQGISPNGMPDGWASSGYREQMLRHVVNHSTYHRGQIATMLRQLGAKAASTDLIIF